MNTLTITIPKNIIQRNDLVVVPREEYEEFLMFRSIKEFTSTPAQKRALRRAQKNLLEHKTLSLHELAKHLGFAN